MKPSRALLVVCLSLVLPALASAAAPSVAPSPAEDAVAALPLGDGPEEAVRVGDTVETEDLRYAGYATGERGRLESPHDAFGLRLVGTTLGGVGGMLSLGFIGMGTGLVLDVANSWSPSDIMGLRGAVVGGLAGAMLGVVPGVLFMGALTGTRGSVGHAVVGQLAGSVVGLGLLAGSALVGSAWYPVGLGAVVLMPALGAALGFQLGAPVTQAEPSRERREPSDDAVWVLAATPLRDGALVGVSGTF